MARAARRPELRRPGRLARHAGGRPPRGTVLHEAMLAIGLAAAILAGATQMLAEVQRQQNVGRQRLDAQLLVSNLAEDARSCYWSDCTASRLETAGTLALSAAGLPDARLQVEVVPADEENSVRRIQLQLDWSDSHGGRSGPVSLVMWRHALGEVQP